MWRGRSTRVVLTWIAAGAAFAAATLSARSAAACSCFSYPDAREYARQANFVFEGEIEQSRLYAQGTVHRVRISRYWKGDLGPELEILSGPGACQNGSCDASLIEGERYLVFAQSWSWCLPGVDLCSGTLLASAATEALDQLGPGVLPGSGPGPYDEGAVEPPRPDCAALDDPSTCLPGTGGTSATGGSAGTGGFAAAGSSGGSAGSPGAAAGPGSDVNRNAVNEEGGGCACRAEPTSTTIGVWAIGLLTFSVSQLRRRRVKGRCETRGLVKGLVSHRGSGQCHFADIPPVAARASAREIFAVPLPRLTASRCER